MKKGFTINCHSELYKVNRHSEASLVNLYASAKPLAVSESHKQEMLSSADRLATAHYVARARFVNQVQHDRQNKKAFTLAEVLITLTIIGVIAAITIPNLMQSWRKHERITQIKTAYSILQNATKMAVAENGNPDGWDFDGENRANAQIRTITKYYFLPYVKVQTICQDNNKGLSNTCFKNRRWFKLNGDDYGNGAYEINYTSQFKLRNGMDIAIWSPQKSQQSDARYIYFFVDVDGQKGTSTLGKDVFIFKYNLDTGKFSTGGNPNQSTYSQNDCTLTSSGNSCAYWIEKNHWEFPDNYPVKKW